MNRMVYTKYTVPLKKIELALRSPGRRHLRRRRIHEKISLLERCIFCSIEFSPFLPALEES